MITRIGRAIPSERRVAPVVHAMEADGFRPTRTIGQTRFPNGPRPGAFLPLTAGLSQLRRDRMALTAGRV
jgi:hypothetical protein